MAQASVAIVQAIVGILEATFRFLPFILQVLLYITVQSITLILYALSPKFRRRKHRDWTQTPWRKTSDLATSAITLTALLTIAVWISWS